MCCITPLILIIMKTFFTAILLVSLTMSSSSFAQNPGAEILKQANSYFDAQVFDVAIERYRDVLLVDNSLEAKKQLAESYRLNFQYEKSEYWYRVLIHEMDLDSLQQLHFAQVLQSLGKYEEAKKYFLEFGKGNPWGLQLAKGIDARKMLENTNNNFSVNLLSVNSTGSDFCGQLYGEGIVFCSNGDFSSEEKMRSPINRGRRTFVSVYYTEKDETGVQVLPTKLKGKINSQFNDGPIFFTHGGTKAIFTRNAFFNGKKMTSANGTLTLSIYEAEQSEDGKWDKIIPFQHNSKEYSVAHPTLSLDGNTLYFASDMPGGQGGMDIYMCSKIDTIWSRPVNLGNKINTPGNEVFPSLHSDGTLYFSSNGHPGLGGLDIYSSRRVGGKWKSPKNLGVPLNSNYDDFGLIMQDDKTAGFFSSNRTGGIGADDIYYFSLKNSKGDKVVSIAENTEKWTSKLESTDMVLNDRLSMSKVYFAIGDFEVLPEAKQELDKVALFLQKNPARGVSLNAHTASKGDDFVNLEISKKRAEAAKAYLMSKNIDGDRIITNGLGETQLLNECQNGVDCPNELHEINDRLTVKLSSSEPVNMEQLFFPKVAIPPVTAATNPTGTRVKVPAKGGKKKVKEILTPIDETTSRKTIVLRPADRVQGSDFLEMENDTVFLDEVSFEYRIFIGPYEQIDNNLYYTFAEIDKAAKKKYTDRGGYVVLGPYNNIEETERLQALAKERGAKKAKIYVYHNDMKVDLSTRRLKKLGVQ